MKHRIITADYHRNGIGGMGFYVAIVETTDTDRPGRYLCVDFTGHEEDETFDDGRFAVLRMDELTAGNIGMFPITDPSGVIQEGTGGNAWRGADHWGHDLRGQIRAWVSLSNDAALEQMRRERESGVTP